MARFEIFRQDQKDISILNLTGELDAHTASDFERALQTLLREKRVKIIVSMKELEYLSSAGLNVFLGYVDEVRGQNGDIKISQTSPRVYKVFDWVGYTRLYEFYDTTEEAIRKF
jgi:anti-sigma B factor antagonist